MLENDLKSQAFTLKGRLYTFTVISILHTDYEEFNQQLGEIIAKAPRMFNNTPIVLDFSQLQHVPDIVQLCDYLRYYGLVPVGIQGGNDAILAAAQDVGLARFNASSTRDKILIAPSADTRTRIITTPVRSGQQVVSKGDLVITSTVGHGAELLADGNIHVYGTLRGRALAGLSGNTEARIFCQTLDAELISVAGFYRLSDTMDKVTVPCQIYLEEENIQIKAL